MVLRWKMVPARSMKWWIDNGTFIIVACMGSLRAGELGADDA
jgi:hypothetical protein